MGTWKSLNIFVSYVSSWILNFFYRNQVLRVLKFTSIQSKSRSNQRCDLTEWPRNLNLDSFLFLFSAMNFKSFQRTMTTCAYCHCSIAINVMLFFNSSGTHWASFVLSLHFFKLSGKTRLFEIIFFYNFVDCPPWSCIYFVYFSNVLLFLI